MGTIALSALALTSRSWSRGCFPVALVGVGAATQFRYSWMKDYQCSATVLSNVVLNIFCEFGTDIVSRMSSFISVGNDRTVGYAAVCRIILLSQVHPSLWSGRCTWPGHQAGDVCPYYRWLSCNVNLFSLYVRGDSRGCHCYGVCWVLPCWRQLQQFNNNGAALHQNLFRLKHGCVVHLTLSCLLF